MIDWKAFGPTGSHGVRIWTLVVYGVLVQQIVSEVLDNDKLSGAKLAEAIVLLGLLAQVTTHTLGKSDADWGQLQYYIILSVTSVVYSALNKNFTFSLNTLSTSLTNTEIAILWVAGGAVGLALLYSIQHARAPDIQHAKAPDIQHARAPDNTLVAWACGVALICIVNVFAADNGPDVYYHFHHGLIAWFFFAVFVCIDGNWSMRFAAVALGVMIHGGATWGAADFEFALNSTGTGLEWYWHAISLVVFLAWTCFISQLRTTIRAPHSQQGSNTASMKKASGNEASSNEATLLRGIRI